MSGVRNVAIFTLLCISWSHIVALLLSLTRAHTEARHKMRRIKDVEHFRTVCRPKLRLQSEKETIKKLSRKMAGERD